MADDRAAQIARIQQIERIQALEGKSAQKSADPAQPGVQAIGSTGAEPDWVDTATSIPGKVADAVSKSHLGLLSAAMNPSIRDLAGRGLDYAGGVARTLGAKAVGAVMPGKNPVELVGDDGINTVLGKAPGVGDYAERLGLPTVGVDIPGTNNKKLTSKDLINLIGNAATNPLTYGAAGWAGKKMYNNAIAPLEVEGNRFSKTDVGDELFKNGIASPLKLRERVQAVVDRNMGKATKVEQQATAGGAEGDVAAAMAPAQAHVNELAKYARGDASKMAMVKEMQDEINQRLTTAAKPSEPILRTLPYTEPEMSLKFKPNPEMPVYDSGGKHGLYTSNAPENQRLGLGVVDRVGTPDPVVPNKFSLQGQNQKGISGTRPIVSMNETPLSTTDEKLLSLPRQIGRGDTEGLLEALRKATRGEPGKTKVATGAEDTVRSLPIAGEHEMVTKMIPREATVLDQSEAVPGPSPLETSTWKTDAYNKAKAGAYDTTKRQDAWQTFYKKQGFGLKEATEKAIEKTLGPDAAAEYRATNESTGKMLSTGKAQTRVADQAGRDFTMATSPVPQGTEGVAMAIGKAAGGSWMDALSAAGIQKAARGMRLSQMPVGYGLRTMDPNAIRAGVVGSQLRNSNDNPWSQPQGAK